MGSRGKQNLVLIVWDVGQTKHEERQKRCINQILSNKALFEPKDHVGLLKFNSDETDHPGDMNTFPNVFYECNFEQNHFDIMRAVDETKHTDHEGEFLSGLCVALIILKSRFEADKQSNSRFKNPGDKYESVKVVLVSDQNNVVLNEETRAIAKNLKRLGCIFFAIGNDELELDEGEPEPDVTYFSNAPESYNSLEAIKLILKHVKGAYWQYDEALMNLCMTSKKVNPRKSKILLELGTELKIKVAYFNEIQDETRLEFKVLNQKDITKTTGNDKTFVTKGGKRAAVEEDEVIPGFKFGASIIPFSKVDKEAMEYKSGPACLKIIGFVRQKHISPIIHFGSSTVNISAADQDPASQVAFSGLVRAMDERKVAGLVRRVTQNNGRLQLGVILPRVVEDRERLVFLELPFADDVIQYKFPKTENECTDKQMEAIHQLTLEMDLTSDGVEDFQARCTPNPIKIYNCQLVVDRAKNPDAPLEPPSDFIKSILERPKHIAEAAERMDKVLQAAFELGEDFVPKAPKTRRKNEASRTDVQEVEEAAASQGAIAGPSADLGQPKAAVRVVQVGSLTPAEDFLALIQQGMPLEAVFGQCQMVVLELAVRSQFDFHKPLTAIRVMRSECVKSNPLLYNNWLGELRTELAERGQLGLWLSLMDDHLGPVTVEENPNAQLSTKEALTFLAQQPPDEQLKEEDDMDDLLDLVE